MQRSNNLTAPVLELSVTEKPYYGGIRPWFAPGGEPGAGDIVRVAEAAAEAGISRVLITGSEPLRRPDIIDLCSSVSRIPGITTVGLSTGGAELRGMAPSVKGAGVSVLELRLDTLQKVKHEFITGGNLSHVLRGLSAAEKTGFLIRIATRLMGGVNDDEIYDFTDIVKRRCYEQWFIELGADEEGYVPCSRVLETRRSLEYYDTRDGVARYRLGDDAGLVCLARPADMHRLRVSAAGVLDGRTKLFPLGDSALAELFSRCSMPPAFGYTFSIIDE